MPWDSFSFFNPAPGTRGEDVVSERERHGAACMVPSFAHSDSIWPRRGAGIPDQSWLANRQVQRALVKIKGTLGA